MNYSKMSKEELIAWRVVFQSEINNATKELEKIEKHIRGFEGLK